MKYAGDYELLVNYFNEHTDYEMNEGNVAQCRREYDKYAHTVHKYVIAEENNLQMECEYVESKHWGEEGSWMICRVYDRNKKDYLLSVKEEVDLFFGKSDII